MDRQLYEILKGVSRSFYLSLVFLPHAIRDTLSLSFLLCKIADTIADTEFIPCAQRLEVLYRYQELFLCHAEPKAKKLQERLAKEILHFVKDDILSPEIKLLSATSSILDAIQHLPEPDKQHIHCLVPELTQGMITDLTWFPRNRREIKTLPDNEALDRYTYCVAGCVGRFWTRILRTHFSFAKKWSDDVENIGERFGKGLQMVNILRDLPRDLEHGRCYLPQTELDLYGLTALNLLQHKGTDTIKTLLNNYLRKTRDQLQEGRRYAAFLPLYARRLRAAVLLPMQLGYETLKILEHSEHWLDPAVVSKVSRPKVYSAFFRSIGGWSASQRS